MEDLKHKYFTQDLNKQSLLINKKIMKFSLI